MLTGGGFVGKEHDELELERLEIFKLSPDMTGEFSADGRVESEKRAHAYGDVPDGSGVLLKPCLPLFVCLREAADEEL